jgi:hypothetical protein
MVNPVRQVFDPNSVHANFSLMYSSISDLDEYHKINANASPPVYGNAEIALKEILDNDVSHWLKSMIKLDSNDWVYVTCYPGIGPDTLNNHEPSRLGAKYYEKYASYFKKLAHKYSYYIQGPIVLVCKGLPTKQFLQDLGDIFIDYLNNNFIGFSGSNFGGENGDFTGVGHYSMNSIVCSSEDSMIKWVNHVNDLGPFNGLVDNQPNRVLGWVTQLQTHVITDQNTDLNTVLENQENGVTIGDNDTYTKMYILY